MLQTAVLLALINLAFHASCSLAFYCPTGQYPYYSDCSTCFSIASSDQSSVFSTAASVSSCSSSGGQLITFTSASVLFRIGRYLEGLGLQEEVQWVGYTYQEEGAVLTVDGVVVERALLEELRFPPSAGRNGDCVGVRDGELDYYPCSSSYTFICSYTYSVPKSQLSPAPGIKYVQSNSNLTLTGTILSIGVSGTEWRHNNVPIPTGQAGFVMNRTSLVIPVFNPTSMAGLYQFVVSSQAGVTIVGEWIVREPVVGTLSLEPNDLTIVRDQVAAFECLVTNAVPPTVVTWYNDSKPVKTNSRVVVSAGTLFIKNVQDSDEGSYHCEAGNIAGNLTSRAASLTVIDLNTTGLPMVDVFVMPHTQTVLLGENLTLDCVGKVVSGLPDVQSLTQFVLNYDYDNPIFSFEYPTSPGDLPQYHKDNVTLEDTGEYFCSFGPFPRRVITGFGEATITVEAASSIDQFWTELNSNGNLFYDELLSVPAGFTVTISCHYVSIPSPTVQWYRNGTMFNSGVSTVGNLSTLTLRDVQISGIYQCGISNKHGRDLATVFLCVEQPDPIPGAVTFRVESDSNSSIYVEWNAITANTDLLLLRYEVKVCPHSTNLVNNCTNLRFLSDTTAYIVQDLEAHTIYSVGVAASLPGGTSANTVEVEVSTFPNAPTVPVTNISASYTNDNAGINVEWDPFLPDAIPAFPVTSYEVEYRLMGTSGSGTIVEKVGGAMTSILIDVTSDADTYEVRVRVMVQVMREPVSSVPGPWSEYEAVDKIHIPTTGTMTGGLESPSNPMGLLLFIVLVPVGVVLLLTIAIIGMTLFSCWYRKRPSRVYNVNDGDKNKNSVPFESSNTYVQPGTGAPIPSMPSVDMPTINSALTTHNVNMSVVERERWPNENWGEDVATINAAGRSESSESWKEDFDHLEVLVATLNDTVTSMTGMGHAHSSDTTGMTHAHSSDTSIIISNHSASHDDDTASRDADDAVFNGKEEPSITKSGERYTINIAPLDVGLHHVAPLTVAPLDGANAPQSDAPHSVIVTVDVAAVSAAPLHSSSTFGSNSEVSPLPLVTAVGMAEAGLENTDSDTSIVKENLGALENESRSGTRDSGSDSSIADTWELDEGVELHGYHSNATLEVEQDDGMKYDKNFIELLEYGDSADLTMV